VFLTAGVVFVLEGVVALVDGVVPFSVLLLPEVDNGAALLAGVVLLTVALSERFVVLPRVILESVVVPLPLDVVRVFRLFPV